MVGGTTFTNLQSAGELKIYSYFFSDLELVGRFGAASTPHSTHCLYGTPLLCDLSAPLFKMNSPWGYNTRLAQQRKCTHHHDSLATLLLAMNHH